MPFDVSYMPAPSNTFHSGAIRATASPNVIEHKDICVQWRGNTPFPDCISMLQTLSRETLRLDPSDPRQMARALIALTPVEAETLGWALLAACQARRSWLAPDADARSV